MSNASNNLADGCFALGKPETVKPRQTNAVMACAAECVTHILGNGRQDAPAQLHEETCPRVLARGRAETAARLNQQRPVTLSDASFRKLPHLP